MINRQECWYNKACVLDDCTGCIRYYEMKYLMDNSGLSKSRQISPKLSPQSGDYAVFNFLDEIRLDIVNFVNNGESLYIYSQYTGNGKTSWSIKLLLRYFDQIWSGNGFRVRGKFIYVPLFLDKIKEFENPTSLRLYKEQIVNADLVVWDDIASIKLSDYDRGQLLLIIDQRIADEKANIYTGNLVSHEELSKSLGDRLASRIWNLSTRVEIKSKDWREA